jgi:hypothetical protein
MEKKIAKLKKRSKAETVVKIGRMMRLREEFMEYLAK